MWHLFLAVDNRWVKKERGFVMFVMWVFISSEVLPVVSTVSIHDMIGPWSRYMIGPIVISLNGGWGSIDWNEERKAWLEWATAESGQGVRVKSVTSIKQSYIMDAWRECMSQLKYPDFTSQEIQMSHCRQTFVYLSSSSWTQNNTQSDPMCQT